MSAGPCTYSHYLDVHQQATHQEAEGPSAIVDAILNLVGGMKGDHIWVIVQEHTPAAQDSHFYQDLSTYLMQVSQAMQESTPRLLCMCEHKVVSRHIVQIMTRYACFEPGNLGS